MHITIVTLLFLVHYLSIPLIISKQVCLLEAKISFLVIVVTKVLTFWNMVFMQLRFSIFHFLLAFMLGVS